MGHQKSNCHFEGLPRNLSHTRLVFLRAGFVVGLWVDSWSTRFTRRSFCKVSGVLSAFSELLAAALISKTGPVHGVFNGLVETKTSRERTGPLHKQVPKLKASVLAQCQRKPKRPPLPKKKQVGPPLSSLTRSNLQAASCF